MIGICPYPQPTAETVCSLPGLLYFVWEREAIRCARENGFESPWTQDEVLHKYKFTNIRRRHDRVSKWIIERLIEPAVDSGDEDLWFTLLIARLINWPPTLQALLDRGVIPCRPENFDPKLFEKVVESLKAPGVKVYGAAYMLYPTKMEPGSVKSRAVAKYIIGSAVSEAENIRFSLWGAGLCLSVERAVDALSKCFGISTFIAGQVAADLTYTGADFSDLYSYAPIGPGSQRGLNYLFGRKPFALWRQADFNRELTSVRAKIASELGIEDLTLHDVQSIHCEYSKYCRAVLGEGVPKTKYAPETLF